MYTLENNQYLGALHRNIAYKYFYALALPADHSKPSPCLAQLLDSANTKGSVTGTITSLRDSRVQLLLRESLPKTELEKEQFQGRVNLGSQAKTTVLLRAHTFDLRASILSSLIDFNKSGTLFQAIPLQF